MKDGRKRNSYFSTLLSVFDSLFSRPGTAQPQPVPIKLRQTLPPDKQVELEKLCAQLIKRKELVASGKLQLIGLTNIRKKLGKQWAGLARIVYEITEQVMREHLDKKDVFIRYRDDTYVLIFAHAGLMEAQLKAAAISEGIRERLFALDSEDMKDIEIRNALRLIKADFADIKGFDDFLEDLTSGLEEDQTDGDHLKIDSMPTTAPAPATPVEPGHTEAVANEEAEISVNALEVETSVVRLRAIPHARHYNAQADLRCHYQPLWDVPRNALTTYLALLYEKDQSPEACGIDNHIGLYEGQTPEAIMALDLYTLKLVIAQIETMCNDGRRFLIACPVHYNTLYPFESYEEYKLLLTQMPEEYRQYLVFYVTGTPKNPTAKDPFWFNVTMQPYCRLMLIELPLSHDINFNLPRAAGVKGLAVRLEQKVSDEQAAIKLLNNFGSRTNALNFSLTAVLNVPTLSLTTSAVCAGFSLLGGKAIHGMVENPDTVHRYKHEDLLKALVTQK